MQSTAQQARGFRRALALLRRRQFVLFEAAPRRIDFHAVDRSASAPRPVRFVTAPADGSSIRAELHDLDFTGAFIDTDVALPVGARIAVGFYVRPADACIPVLARATVVGRDVGRRGFAVRFTLIDPCGLAALRQLLVGPPAP